MDKQKVSFTFYHTLNTTANSYISYLIMGLADMTINSLAKKLSVQSPASAKYFQLVANNKLSGRVNDEILLLFALC